MAVFRRRRSGALDQLSTWARARSGIEAYLEPPSLHSGVSLLLVAGDGEFSRREISSARDARDFARRLGVPLYDVNRVGYPQRMREYAQRLSGKSVPPPRASAPRTEATPPVRPEPARFDPTHVAVLARHAGLDAPQSPTADDLRRLWRAARAKAHPDRRAGDRAAWDAVESAAQALGL